MRSRSATYFVTIATAGRVRLFQSDRNASLLREILFHYRDENRYRLHPFVIMPDHIHLLLSPAADQSLERCVQCIKGGFSHTMRTQTRWEAEIWQRSFHDHRIRDEKDYRVHRDYIAGNPGNPQYRFLEIDGPMLDPGPSALSG